MIQTNTAVAQLNMFNILDLDQTVQQAFQSAPVKNKDGKEVGFNITLRKDKDFGAMVELPGKDNKEARAEAKLKRSDELLNMVKGEVAKLNGEWTQKAVKMFTPKDGERELVLRFKEVKRTTTLSEEKLAKFMFPEVQYPAMTLEEKLQGVRDARQRQEAQLASNLLDAGDAQS